MRPAVVSGDVSAEVLPAFGRAGPASRTQAALTDTALFTGPTERGSDSSAAPHRAPRSLCAHRSPRQTLSWPAGLRRPLVWPPGWRVHPRGLRPATPAKRVGPERAAGGECPSPRQRRRLRLTHLRAQRKRSDVFPHASK